MGITRISEDDVNNFAKTPGSAQVMEANDLLAQRIINEPGAVSNDKSVAWRLAIMGAVAAYCGLAKAPLVVNSESFKKVWGAHLKCKVNGKFSKSRAIHKLSPSLIVEAFKAMSALGTSRWCRIHLLGRFARSREEDTNQGPSGRNEEESEEHRFDQGFGSNTARLSFAVSFGAKSHCLSGRL